MTKSGKGCVPWDNRCANETMHTNETKANNAAPPANETMPAEVTKHMQHHLPTQHKQAIDIASIDWLSL